MLRKVLRRLKPDEEICPGKYVLYKQKHFVGFELWGDWTCIVRPTCRTHIGHVQSWRPGLLQTYDGIFKLESVVAGVGKNLSLELQKDAQGGAPVVSFHSPLSGCSRVSLAINKCQQDAAFVLVARDVCSKALCHPPLAMTFLLDASSVPEKLTWSQLGQPQG